jgi:LysM repeat protein
MSLAPDLPPTVHIPSRARNAGRTAAGRRHLRGVPAARHGRGPHTASAAAVRSARPTRCAEPLVPEAWLEPAFDIAALGPDLEPEVWMDPVFEPTAAPRTERLPGVDPSPGAAAAPADAGRRGVDGPRQSGAAWSLSTTAAMRLTGRAPLRLTVRGRLVAALAAVAVALAIILAAVAGAAGRSPASAPAPNRVVVTRGDTLWTLAQRVAPGTDPRKEVVLLQRLNHLSGVALVPGQVLRTR